MPASNSACSLRRAAAIEAITRGCAQKRAGSVRSSGSWLVAQSMPNLLSISSRHCPTSEAGVRIRMRSAMPRSAYSFSTMPASTVLPEPDLVGQQHPAAVLLQHLADRLDLVPMGLDPAQRRQAEQFVESLEQAEAIQFAAQPEPAHVRPGAVEHDRLGVGDLDLHVEARVQPGQIGNRQCGRRRGDAGPLLARRRRLHRRDRPVGGGAVRRIAARSCSRRSSTSRSRSQGNMMSAPTNQRAAMAKCRSRSGAALPRRG